MYYDIVHGSQEHTNKYRTFVIDDDGAGGAVIKYGGSRQLDFEHIREYNITVRAMVSAVVVFSALWWACSGVWCEYWCATTAIDLCVITSANRLMPALLPGPTTLPGAIAVAVARLMLGSELIARTVMFG